MNILGSIRTWNNVRKTRNALGDLPNHILEDLGIERGQISHIAKRVSRT